MTPYLRTSIDTIRERLTRLLGDERAVPLGPPEMREFTPSTPELSWNCEYRGHVVVGEDCVYCDGAG